jgi:hypothetical protein
MYQKGKLVVKKDNLEENSQNSQVKPKWKIG